MDSKLKAGKLPLDLLSELLDGLEAGGPGVALGPRPGEDAALIDLGDRYLVATTDPITFATDLIGWYAVHVNANDIAVMGAAPRWFMVTLLLPEGSTPETVRGVFRQLRDACASLGVSLIGGHTEVTYGLPRPVAAGAMLGEVEKSRVVLTSGARPGDALVVTKGIAIEGASILAREAGDRLAEASVSPASVEAARGLLFSPGISVVRDAAAARDAVDVHAMHDPTEGGLAGGLLEMATASGTGLLLDLDAVPVLPECREFCDALGLDPLGLIASGALLAAVDPGDAPVLIAALGREGVSACEIGRVTRREEGMKLRSQGALRDLPVFDRDELARFLEN